MSRRMSLTLVSIVLRIEFLSSITSSVNITPTVDWFLYQPITSVSLVDVSNTDRILARTFPFFSEAWCPPVSSSMSRNGFLERSVLLRSTDIVRLKASSCRISRSPTDTDLNVRRPRLEPLPVRCWVTISSACSAPCFLGEEQVPVSDLVRDEGLAANRFALRVTRDSWFDYA